MKVLNSNKFLIQNDLTLDEKSNLRITSNIDQMFRNARVYIALLTFTFDLCEYASFSWYIKC